MRRNRPSADRSGGNARSSLEKTTCAHDIGYSFSVGLAVGKLETDHLTWLAPFRRDYALRTIAAVVAGVTIAVCCFSGLSVAGKVTALSVQKKNKKRVSVFLDGRFSFSLPALVAASLRPGQFLSDDEIEALKRRGDGEEAYNRALDYLSYRPRSRAEVVHHLQRHEVPEEQAMEVIDRLERAGLLGDEAFAQYWVENRESYRPRGPRALRFELRSKGLDSDVIEQALQSLDVDESAYRASQKRAEQLRHLDRATFQRKLMEYLSRRGFDYEVAREAAERHWAEGASSR